jgi:hypothetical protein
LFEDPSGYPQTNQLTLLSVNLFQALATSGSIVKDIVQRYIQEEKEETSFSVLIVMKRDFFFGYWSA